MFLLKNKQVFCVIIIILLIYLCLRFIKKRIYQKAKLNTDAILKTHIQQYDDTLKSIFEDKNIYHNNVEKSMQSAYNKAVSSTVERVSQIGLLGLNENDIAEISYILCKNPQKRRPIYTAPENNIIHIETNQPIQHEQIIQPAINALNNIQIEWNLRHAESNIKNNESHVLTGKSNTINNYFNQTKKIKSDSQNVHDSSVNEDMLKTYNILKNDMVKYNGEHNEFHEGFSVIYQDIFTFIQTDDELSYYDKENAILILNRVNNDDLYTHSIVVHNRPIKVKELAYLVWKRAYHPANQQNQKEIKHAIIKAMADCVESGNAVCSGGIAARLLTSLVLLDFNPQVGHTMTKQCYKNEVMGKANNILQETIREYANQNTDLDLKRFAESYLNPQIDDSNISQDIKNQFYMVVEKKIDNMLLEYNGKISPEIKTEIMAGIQI